MTRLQASHSAGQKMTYDSITSKPCYWTKDVNDKVESPHNDSNGMWLQTICSTSTVLQIWVFSVRQRKTIALTCLRHMTLQGHLLSPVAWPSDATQKQPFKVQEEARKWSPSYSPSGCTLKRRCRSILFPPALSCWLGWTRFSTVASKLKVVSSNSRLMTAHIAGSTEHMISQKLRSLPLMSIQKMYGTLSPHPINLSFGILENAAVPPSLASLPSVWVLFNAAQKVTLLERSSHLLRELRSLFTMMTRESTWTSIRSARKEWLSLHPRM